MKNKPMAPDSNGSVSPAPSWQRALALYDADLRRRGAAERTRRAYGSDLGDVAMWCSNAGLDPETVTHTDVRRYAAALSERRVAPATLARKLAALRGFFRTLREHGVIETSPSPVDGW